MEKRLGWASSNDAISKLQRGRKFLDATGDLDHWKGIIYFIVSRPDDPSHHALHSCFDLINYIHVSTD